jgi:dihydropteroate synthase
MPRAGRGQMGTGEPETTMAAGQGGPIGLSAPFVRVFSLSTGADLVDELRSLGGAGGTSPVQNLLQVAVKLLVPSAWRTTVGHVVADFPGLTLYTQPRGAHEDALLVIGPTPQIQACARALSVAERAMAPLALELLNQLAYISPKTYHTFTCGGRSLDFSVKTGIMGILNVTPDSFYDGGRYLDPQLAVDRAHQMVAEGADIIDIGGQSSRPGSEPVSEAEEADRVLPVVQAVAKSVSAMISVDTYRAAIARVALEAGAHLINDISALRFDPALLGVVAEHRAPLILMHMQGMPRTMQLNPTYEALIDEVFSFLHRRLEAAKAGGIAAECLLIDPGIGFGKGARHNLELLHKLHQFHALGQPLVIGTSRKAFVGWILGAEVDERLEGTAATVAAAIVQGADIVRVHDVLAMARVARMMDAMVRPHFDTHVKGQKAVEPSRAAGERHRGA